MSEHECRACMVARHPPPPTRPEFPYLAAIVDAAEGTPHNLCDYHKFIVESVTGQKRKPGEF